jgi:H+/Cl- antiporter ClcA
VDNIHISGGPEGLRSLRSLIPVSLLGISAGGGIGPEGPLVQICGTIGSWLGRHFDLPRTELRTITITGMAAGFTVLFGSPLGGAVFALEVLHREGLEYYEALIPSVFGALAGFAIYVATTHLGLQPVWDFAEAPKALHLTDLGYSVGCGVVGAAVAILFTYVTLFFRALFRPLPTWSKPVMTAFLLGAVAYISPYALTFSEYQLQHLVTVPTVAAATLLLAFLGHMLSAPITMAGNWKGGFIIPLFFMGYCLGRAATPFLPGANEIVLATALMVACNVGVTKTPLASVLVVAGMSGLRLMPTMLIASMISLFLTSSVHLLESQRRRESINGEEVTHENDSVEPGDALPVGV